MARSATSSRTETGHASAKATSCLAAGEGRCGRGSGLGAPKAIGAPVLVSRRVAPSARLIAAIKVIQNC